MMNGNVKGGSWEHRWPEAGRGGTASYRAEREIGEAVTARAASERAAAGGSRLDRRKARTRQALIDAAARLIAERRGDRASIQEITEAADVGFGSFYNHFDSKEQLFLAAAEEVLERWGQMIDRATVGISDPAELFAVGVRISGRLGWTHPDIAGFLTGAGLDTLDMPRGLAPRALRDIQAGQATGRFTVSEAEVALSAVAGGLLGLLRLHQRHPERVQESAVDQLAEAILRLLGVPAPEAAALAALPLPGAGTW
jgi:AcrR family transcriptional regulator